MSSRSRAKGLGRDPTSCQSRCLWRGVLGSPYWELGLGRAWAAGLPLSHESWAEAWLSAVWHFPFWGA